MTDERNVKIAKWMKLDTSHPIMKYPGTETPVDVPIPDFCNSRDAMALAEAKITKKKEYADILQDVCMNHVVGSIADYPKDLIKLYALVTASASKRADALIAVIESENA